MRFIWARLVLISFQCCAETGKRNHDVVRGLGQDRISLAFELKPKNGGATATASTAAEFKRVVY